jgi:hypothetical protein
MERRRGKGVLEGVKRNWIVSVEMKREEKRFVTSGQALGEWKGDTEGRERRGRRESTVCTLREGQELYSMALVNSITSCFISTKMVNPSVMPAVACRAGASSLSLVSLSQDFVDVGGAVNQAFPSD